MVLLEQTKPTFTWGPLYHTAAMTGLRESEIRGLTWDDVDLDEATINVSRALKFTLIGRHADGRRRREWAYGSVKTSASGGTVDLTGDTVAARSRFILSASASGCP